ncbi:hypothetical protein L195_g023358 [Trifolium pratense]|uniref:Uncharacterized protein n=1 Tax=Trifolium pratense TaxID=57577 RepID=A0A2K3NAM7_TRIPR|nr:hypothetical protein L195_g023358 [Trifolium pratense]
MSLSQAPSPAPIILHTPASSPSSLPPVSLTPSPSISPTPSPSISSPPAPTPTSPSPSPSPSTGESFSDIPVASNPSKAFVHKSSFFMLPFFAAGATVLLV